MHRDHPPSPPSRIHRPAITRPAGLTFLILLTLANPAGAVEPNGSNLVVNGDFDDDLSAWSLHAHAPVWSPSDWEQSALSGSARTTGDFAAWVTHLQQCVVLPTHPTVDLSYGARMRTTGDHYPRLRVQTFTSSDCTSGATVVLQSGGVDSTDWVEHSETEEISASVRSVLVELQATYAFGAGGDALWDGVWVKILGADLLLQAIGNPGPQPSVPGTLVSLDLRVENLTQPVANHAITTVFHPSRLQFAGSSGCEGNVDGSNPTAVQWLGDNLSAGEVNTCSILYEVLAGNYDEVTWVAFVTHDDPDPEPSNNTQVVASLVLDDYIDMSPSIVLDPESTTAGQPVEVHLSLFNHGSRPASGAESTMHVSLPVGLSFAAADSCSGASWDGAERVVEVPMGTVEANGLGACAFGLEIDAGTSAGAYDLDAVVLVSLYQAGGGQRSDSATLTVVSTTFVVSTAADGPDADPGDGTCAAASGECTLRAAIMESNELAGPGWIVPLPFDGDFQLAAGAGDGAGDLDIRDDLVIWGFSSRPSLLKILAAPGDRVFEIHGDIEVTLENLSIENGDPPSPQQGGGVLQAAAGSVLHLDTVDFVGNAAVWGAGIAIFGSADLEEVLFRQGQATVGGGVFVGDTGDVVIRGSTLHDNHAQEGGGIRVLNGAVRVLNSTFTDNSGATSGGALFLGGGSAVLNNTTVADNWAGYSGGVGTGGAFALSSGAEILLRNSIVSGNEAFDSGGQRRPQTCSGTLTGAVHSVIHPGEDADCAFGAGVTGALIEEAMLGPLDPWGGDVPTRPLLQDSPGIDHGDPSGCDWDPDGNGPVPVTSDQARGRRPRDGDEDGGAVCDAGAFELQQVVLFGDGFESGDTAAWGVP